MYLINYLFVYLKYIYSTPVINTINASKNQLKNYSNLIGNDSKNYKYGCYETLAVSSNFFFFVILKPYFTYKKDKYITKHNTI